MRLVLIAPSGAAYVWRKKRTAFTLPPMALPLLAAVTPPGVTVTLLDEAVEDIDLNLEADLVGFSVMTANAPRAYALGDHFRSRGIKVVMGGIHPSSLPEEALQHADAVAIGEGEPIWAQLLKDAAQNQLKSRYQSPAFPSLNGPASLRWDLLARDRYFIPQTVQTSRGCPIGCHFCSVSAFFGRTFRKKALDQILEEIHSLPKKLVIFVDDNIVGEAEFSKRLFEAMIPLKKKWVAQSSLAIVEDPELLDLAARSGCIGLLIGFESISRQVIKRMGKGINLRRRYQEAVSRIHDRGIQIQGSFIFGFDEDTAASFDETLQFVRQVRLSGANYCLLTPYPGTRLFQEYTDEGRILSRDWSRYDRNHVVFQPIHFSPDELQERTRRAYLETYNWKSLWKRRPPGFQHISLYLALNFGYWRGARKL
jgi:radical SAM superfamily enzyme YgiQ (UPF0313 family)